MAKLIIDVSEHQGKINWQAIKSKIDGAIIRCGYGDDEKSQDDAYWAYNVAQCENLGIPYGVYLYSYADSDAHIQSEIAHVKRLLGKHKPQYPVYIDLEDTRYGSFAVKAANAFCKAIKAAGYVAGVYTYESYYNEFMHGYKSYTLWIAKYGANDGKAHDKPNIGVSYDAWQFTSNLHIAGYGGRLDASYFYKEWTKSAANASTASTSTAAAKTKTIKRGIVAAAIHADMCNDNDNGYSWDPRWGEDGKGVKTVIIDGEKYDYNRGSYDCSSSVIAAWKSALASTQYAKALDGATFTGNMRKVFVNSGLFVWKPMSFLAEPGDLYLNEDSHVAMCQTQTPDILSEFSINELGGTYGGKVGDQTGKEAYTHAYYDYPWDGILHYNGKADSASESGSSTDKTAVTFRLSIDAQGKKWLAANTQTTSKAIRYIAIKNVGQYRVHTVANGWLPYVSAYDVNDLEYGCAGDGSVINAVEVVSSSYRYAVRVNGKWYPDMIGRKDTGGSSDHFAGDMANSLDGFRIEKA